MFIQEKVQHCPNLNTHPLSAEPCHFPSSALSPRLQASVVQNTTQPPPPLILRVSQISLIHDCTAGSQQELTFSSKQSKVFQGG